MKCTRPRLLAVITAACLLSIIPACAGTPQVDPADVEALGDAVSELRVSLEDGRATLAALPAEDQADPTITKAADVLDKLAPVLASLDENLKAQPDDAAGIAAAGINTAAPFLPPPWNILAGILGAAGIGMWREWEGRKRAKRIATAIEIAKDAQGAINFANAETIKRLDTVLTKSDKAIVDSVQVKTKA